MKWDSGAVFNMFNNTLGQVIKPVPDHLITPDVKFRIQII